MQLFYAPDIATTLALPDEEARHCFQVLRHKIGDLLSITDGKGNWYTAEVANDHVKKNQLIIRSCEDRRPTSGRSIHLAIGPTKNIDRMEWLVEKAVEIGVHKISFVISKHSERKQVKTDRLEKKAISAMKQSLKCVVPKLEADITWTQFLAQPQEGQCFIAHLDANAVQLYTCLAGAGEKVCLAIGPEGGFSDEEVAQAVAKGYKTVQLGDYRLRTETAGLVGLTLLNQK